MGYKNIEAGRDLQTDMETKDLLNDYSEAVEKSQNTKEIAGLKVGVAHETFNNVPNVTPERQEAVKKDIQGATENEQFEIGVQRDKAESALRPEAKKLSELCESNVDAGAFRTDENMTSEVRQADANMAGAGEEAIEGAAGAIGAYQSSTGGGGVSAIS